MNDNNLPNLTCEIEFLKLLYDIRDPKGLIESFVSFFHEFSKFICVSYPIRSLSIPCFTKCSQLCLSQLYIYKFSILRNLDVKIIENYDIQDFITCETQAPPPQINPLYLNGAVLTS